MNQKNEQELLKRAKSCDLVALGEIYDRYSPGIYRYAIRLLGDDFLSEECVSETFSRFLQAVRNNRGPNDHLQAYLYRIAHNWITDTYRRVPPQPVALNDSMEDAEYPVPEKQVDIHMEQNKIRLALRSLTPEQRQVVTLRFIEGWENDEVAFALGKPVGSIKALQFRGLRMLRKILLGDQKAGAYEFEG